MGDMKHIAVIEENEEQREMLERLLKCLGYEATGYDSPSSFHCVKERCDSERGCFDAIMTDYRSRWHQDGVEFVRQLERKKCKIPKLAVISASWDNEGLEKSRALKCKLLSKPFSVKELEEWLNG